MRGFEEIRSLGKARMAINALPVQADALSQQSAGPNAEERQQNHVTTGFKDFL
jgi:hypothetical protein